METLQGVLAIKTAGLETQRKAQFARLSHDLFTCLQRQKVYQQVKEGLYQLTAALRWWFLCWWCCRWCTQSLSRWATFCLQLFTTDFYLPRHADILCRDP